MTFFEEREIMDKTIEEIIEKADSENVEDLIWNAERYLKTKSNLFFAEIFMRKILTISEGNGDALDLLDRLGTLYYGKKKSIIDNNKLCRGDVDIPGLKKRLGTIKDHKEIFDVLMPVIDCDEETIVKTINGAILSHADSAIAVAGFLGEKYVDPEYLDKVRVLNVRSAKGGALDYIKAINKNILRKVLNTPGVEIVKDNFTIDKNKFILKFVERQTCAYCNSGLMDLLRFYAIKNPKRGRGLSWEIDRKDPVRGYEENNYAFVCYYCNNAKSDVFTESEFRKTVGPAIGQTISDVLKR